VLQPLHSSIPGSESLREAFGDGVALNMQNLMNSHDATRLASAVANPDGKKFGDWGHILTGARKAIIRIIMLESQRLHKFKNKS
jgi:hypothetical protein